MKKYKEIIETELKKYFDMKRYNLPPLFPKEIFESMAYTTLMGGKRLRAILCLEGCRMVSSDYKNAIPLACALEMLHAQSLIHDDLPSMDNDDLRRGKPSNHKVFGEAMAILAGDALISFGAQIILENSTINKEEILSSYLKAAGVFGIVGGQSADILSEGEKITPEKLDLIHKYKTGALFECAMQMGALSGGADEEELGVILEFAKNFGLAFQIYDDILDVISSSEELGKTAGKDEKENKATYVKLYGLEASKEKFNILIKKCYNILDESKYHSKVIEEILKGMSEKING